MIKPLLVLFLTTLLSLTTKAQFYKSVLPSPEFNAALEKIVRDFRHNFNNITGEKLYSQGEVDSYESTVKLPGASNCYVNRYHSVTDTTASWQAELYSGEDYKEAIKIYRNTFRLLNKSKMQQVDRSVMTFSGNLEEPVETIRFATSTLTLDVDDRRYRNFVAEVELISSYNGFLVNVSLHAKRPTMPTVAKATLLRFCSTLWQNHLPRAHFNIFDLCT
jgi:hypothetical protein